MKDKNKIGFSHLLFTTIAAGVAGYLMGNEDAREKLKDKVSESRQKAEDTVEDIKDKAQKIKSKGKRKVKKQMQKAEKKLSE